jgi:hypothetical protein
MIGPKASLGHHFGKVGHFLDGTVSGGTSAFTVALTYDGFNTYGAAKRQQENAAKVKGGVNYNERKPRALPDKTASTSIPGAESDLLADPDVAAAVAQASRYNEDIYADFR